MLDAGDTLFIRGGIYSTKVQVEIGLRGAKSGTKTNPICVFSYLDEEPILDCASLMVLGGLFIHDVSYWKFKGLTIRNAKQNGSFQEARGFTFNRCNNIEVIECNSHDNEGQGFFIGQSDSIVVINCDSYNNCNFLAKPPSKPGGAGTGFLFLGTQGDSDTTNWARGYFYGCRSWNNSDNGFGSAYSYRIVYDNCWSIGNGWRLFDPENPDANGDGRGFVIGHVFAAAPPSDQAIVKNCLAAYNTGPGFHVNSNADPYTANIRWYSNTAAYNREWGFRGSYGTRCDPIIFRNNLSYSHKDKISWDPDAEFSMENGMTYTSDHNSWDFADLSLSDDDFLSVDSSGLTGPRDELGNLPDLPFLKLAPGSALIDAGTPITGLGYHDDAPDIGYSESGELEVFITSPGNGSTFKEPLNLIITTKTSFSDELISKVEFFDGTIKLGERTSEPWSFNRNNVSAGTHSITAIAWDNSGSKAVSPVVSLKVRPNVNRLYPNPNNGNFTLELADPATRTANVTIFSLTGESVFTDLMYAEELVKQFDLTYLEPCTYILCITESEIITVERFIIQ